MPEGLTFFEAAAYACTIVATALFLRTLLLVVRTRRLIRDGSRATGTVIDFEERTEERVVADSSRSSGMSSEEVKVYFPRIRFTAEDGTVVAFRSRFKTDQRPMLSLNAEVRVLYDPSTPAATAEIEGRSKQWDPVIRSTIETVLVLVFAVLAFRQPK